MNILFWVDKFPTYSETFIRDQIICILDQGEHVLIYPTGGYNSKEINAISHLNSYQLKERIVDIDGYFESNKFKRTFKAVRVIIQSIFNGHFKYYVRSLSKSYGKLAKSLRLFFRVHFLLKHQVEVIHAHFGPNGNDALVFKKIGLPLKLFTTFHGYDIRLGVAKGGKIYSELFEFADGIIAISNYNHDHLIRFGIKKEKLVYLPNGIDTNYFRNPQNQNKNGRTIKFLTVARLVKEKALDVAINALSQFVNQHSDLVIEYYIIGEGEERGKLQALIDELKLDKVVKLLGAKTTDQVKQHMGNSHIFLLSSSNEALPTVLLEAQASEMLVLATDVGAVKSIVKGGLVVAPSDIKSFKEGMDQLFKQQEDWQKITTLGREYVSDNHSLKEQTKKLLKLYS